MGKKMRSKPKKRGSRSGRQINTQGCESKITQNSESKINQDCEDQIIAQDCDGQITNQDCEGQIITPDCEGQIITYDSEREIVTRTSDCFKERDDCFKEPEIVTQTFDSFNEDGILCSIISSLPLREAVRTCVLSRRWRHIWTYLPVLNFYYEHILDSETLELYESSLTAKEKCYLLMGKTDYFIQSVDSVLQQHHGRARLEGINIEYFLHKEHSHHLDAWVRFAVSSKTKKLYLHLEQPHSTFKVELYDFPLHLLASSSIEELYLVNCTLKPPYQFDCLNRLTILAMWYPGDTREDINHLVSHCSSLRRLDVLGSKELVILSIPQSLRQLRKLTVVECDHLKEIKINAVNLNYIGYEGVPVDFVLRQSSCLKKAKIYFKSEGTDYNLNFYLTKLAKDLPHLQFLTLNIDGVSQVEDLPKCSPSFNHLKRLDWDCPKWSVGAKMGLLHLETLLDAAPFLEVLKLHLSACGVEEAPPRVAKLKKKIHTHPRPHLKTVEICGFYFERWQLQIVLYLLKNAVELDSLTLEMGQKPLREINETDIKSLTQQVPSNVKLVIL